MGFDAKNVNLIVLTIYSLFVTFVILPSYAYAYTEYYKQNVDIGDSHLQINYTLNTSSLNQTIAIGEFVPIGFWQGLWISLTDVPVAGILAILFVFLPDLWLIIEVYDKIRGI